MTSNSAAPTSLVAVLGGSQTVQDAYASLLRRMDSACRVPVALERQLAPTEAFSVTSPPDNIAAPRQAFFPVPPSMRLPRQQVPPHPSARTLHTDDTHCPDEETSDVRRFRRVFAQLDVTCLQDASDRSRVCIPVEASRPREAVVSAYTRRHEKDTFINDHLATSSIHVVDSSVRMRKLIYLEGHCPLDSHSETASSDISWMPSPRRSQHRTSPPCCNEDTSRSGGVRGAGVDYSRLPVALFRSDDDVRRELHTAEVQYQLLGVCRRENLRLCVDHEAVIRCVIEELFLEDAPLLQLLGDAIGQLLLLWSTAEQDIHRLFDALQCVRLEECSRLEIEAAAWSCSAHRHDAWWCGEQEASTLASSAPVSAEIAASSARFASAACPCYQLDVDVRRMSGIHFPPEPKQTCTFVNTILSGGMHTLLLREHAEYLLCMQSQLEMLVTAEFCLARVLEEEASSYSMMSQYAAHELRRATVEAVRGELCGSSRRAAPMTFRLFSRLWLLQREEECKRETLEGALYWSTLTNALAAAESVDREKIGSDWLGDVVSVIGCRQAVIGKAWIEAYEAECRQQLNDRFCTAVSQQEIIETQLAARQLVALLAATMPLVVTLEGARRRQLDLLEGQIFLRVSSLFRDTSRELRWQLDSALASTVFSPLQSSALTDSHFSSFSLLRRNITNGGHAILSSSSMRDGRRVLSEADAIAFAHDMRTTQDTERLLRSRIVGEQHALFERTQPLLRLWADVCSTVHALTVDFSCGLDRLAVLELACRQRLALIAEFDADRAVFDAALPTPRYGCYARTRSLTALPYNAVNDLNLDGLDFRREMLMTAVCATEFICSSDVRLVWGA